MSSIMVRMAASTPDLTGAFKDAVGGAQTQVLAYVGIAVGAALAIIIAIFAIKKGISFFKSMANKG